MTIAVASGKGGTGKTTVALNLALAMGQAVNLVDADVEEPNAHLFLGGEVSGNRPVMRRVPRVDGERCTACGVCAEVCQFNAMVVLPSGAMVFGELCHACGACVALCPQGALDEVEERLGTVETRQCEAITLVTGRLDVGQPTAPPVVTAARAAARGELTLIDAPPGTACAVVAAVRGVDFLLLVTEPTPFGLHDLRLAVELARELDLPHAVVINRADSGDDGVRRWCATERVEVAMELPDDRRVAEAYARGELLWTAVPEYRPRFEALAARLWRAL